MNLAEWRARQQEGEAFTLPSGLEVRLKKVALIDLAQAGQIPTTLRAPVAEMLKRKPDQAVDLADVEKFGQVLNIVVAACIVEPADLKPEELPSFDKQTIFNIIFETQFSEFFKGLFVIFDAGNISFFEKIRRMIHHEINTLLKHPDLARFVINEIAQDPERLLKHGNKIGINPRILIDAFEKQTEEEIKNGTIRPIEGRMLLIHIMSLCLYPFVARPVLETLMQLNSEQFTALMERRKEETYEFIINSIKK